MTDETWYWLIAAYALLAIGTFIPTAQALFQKVQLLPGGSGFDESPSFSPEAKEQLRQHYSRIAGTLGFWKTHAARHTRFHQYCLAWSVVIGATVPVLVQYVSGSVPASKWLITIISLHGSVSLGLHRIFRVEANLKVYRHGESEFYDLRRRLLDTPRSFGRNEAAQVTKYFEEVAIVRRYVRNGETDNLPTIEEARPKLQSHVPDDGSHEKP